MNWLCLPSMILTGLLAGSCLAAEKDDLAVLVDYQANQLRKVVDAKRWTITQTGKSIRIESTFELTKQRHVSPAFGLPPEKTKYCIDLRFEPQLPKEEYLKLAKERADHAVVCAYGAPTKDAYADSFRFLQQHPLPRYNTIDRVGKAYSVYFTSTDSGALALGPVSLYAEARGVEGIVDRLLWPITQ